MAAAGVPEGAGGSDCAGPALGLLGTAIATSTLSTYSHKHGELLLTMQCGLLLALVPALADAGDTLSVTTVPPLLTELKKVATTLHAKSLCTTRSWKGVEHAALWLCWAGTRGPLLQLLLPAFGLPSLRALASHLEVVEARQVGCSAERLRLHLAPLCAAALERAYAATFSSTTRDALDEYARALLTAHILSDACCPEKSPPYWPGVKPGLQPAPARVSRSRTSFAAAAASDSTGAPVHAANGQLGASTEGNRHGAGGARVRAAAAAKPARRAAWESDSDGEESAAGESASDDEGGGGGSNDGAWPVLGGADALALQQCAVALAAQSWPCMWCGGAAEVVLCVSALHGPLDVPPCGGAVHPGCGQPGGPFALAADASLASSFCCPACALRRGDADLAAAPLQLAVLSQLEALAGRLAVTSAPPAASGRPVVTRARAQRRAGQRLAPLASRAPRPEPSVPVFTLATAVSPLPTSTLLRVRTLLEGPLRAVFVSGIGEQGSDGDVSRLCAFAASPPRVHGQLSEFIDTAMATRCVVCGATGKDGVLCPRLRSRRDSQGGLGLTTAAQLAAWARHGTWGLKGHSGYVWFACSRFWRSRAAALAIQAALAAAVSGRPQPLTDAALEAAAAQEVLPKI